MKQNNFFKAGLSFGVTMAVFFIIQNMVMNDENNLSQILKSVLAGMIGGTVAGFLYGLLLSFFVKSRFYKKATKIVTNDGETILFDSGANHYEGREAVGGKLYLTNDRLVFKSHTWNLQNHELSILLTEIEGFKRYKTLGIVNNGLEVTVSPDQREKFVLEDITTWIEKLSEKTGLSLQD